MKCFFKIGLLLFSVVIFIGCSSIDFYDSKISMSESCVVVIEEGAANTIFDENWKRTKLSQFGKKEHFVLPAGKYTFAYVSSYWEPINEDNLRFMEQGVSYLATLKTTTSVSETFDFEAGKRYRLERSSGKIEIIDTEKRGISENGTMVAFRHIPLLNALGWQYRNGINVVEIGPQIGLSIVSDPTIVHINGEGAIGIGGVYGIGIPNNFSIGFSYRLGGSAITFLRKRGFGLGLGGGIIGHILTIPINSQEGVGLSEDLGKYGNPLSLFPQVPYIQLKGFLGEYEGFGIYIEYYPTVRPIGIGSFGFGFTSTF